MSVPLPPEINEIARPVLERIAARIARGDSPPDGRIPNTKDEFPKVLCLDQNKWIDLAKAHYGRPDGKPFLDALGSIRRATEQNTLVVPIFPSNAAEIAEPGDVERRKRTATFMVALSGNRFFAYPDPVESVEIRRAIGRLYLGHDVGQFARALLVRWGLPDGDLSGIWPTEVAHLVDVLREPEWSVATLVHAQDRNAVTEMRAMDRRAADASRAARAGTPHEKRYDEELQNLYRSGGSFSTRMRNEAARLGVDIARFEDWLGENRRRFAEAIPSLDVECRLMLARDRNPQHRTHHNDLKDLAFLQSAIPHGNIVVTENSWAHFARKECMDKKYATEILSDLRDVPALLEAMGCLRGIP